MLLAWLATSFLPFISISGCGLPPAYTARPPAGKPGVNWLLAWLPWQHHLDLSTQPQQGVQEKQGL